MIYYQLDEFDVFERQFTEPSGIFINAQGDNSVTDTIMIVYKVLIQIVYSKFFSKIKKKISFFMFSIQFKYSLIVNAD